MIDGLRLFVGPPLGLKAFTSLSPHAEVFALTQKASVLAVPLTDDLQDAVHASAGTGTWLDTGPRLASGDMAFAARASTAAALGYIEIFTSPEREEECGVLWSGGVLKLGPAGMIRGVGVPARPRSLWPVNVVLRGLGIDSRGYADEGDAFGVRGYRSVEELRSGAVRVEV